MYANRSGVHKGDGRRSDKGGKGKGKGSKGGKGGKGGKKGGYAPDDSSPSCVITSDSMYPHARHFCFVREMATYCASSQSSTVQPPPPLTVYRHFELMFGPASDEDDAVKNLMVYFPLFSRQRMLWLAGLAASFQIYCHERALYFKSTLVSLLPTNIHTCNHNNQYR